jgi:hypothetical protein
LVRAALGRDHLSLPLTQANGGVAEVLAAQNRKASPCSKFIETRHVNSSTKT